MPGEATRQSEAAPVVVACADPCEASLLRELEGSVGSYRAEEMEDVGSEASSGLCEMGSEMEEEEWEGKGDGRPN